MEVPFDKIGAGQSGRLVYEVVGKDGPISNPTNIRFMPPDSEELSSVLPSVGSTGMLPGLAGANLICSVLSLPMSAYIMQGISDLRQTIYRVEKKIDYIVKKIDRIDTQVAENNFRHSMNHVLQKTVLRNDIDLAQLVVICEDLDKFGESMPEPWLLNFGFRLSVDVRDRLQQIYDILYGIRRLVAYSYNYSIDADPDRIVTVLPTRDYFYSTYGGDLDMLVRAATVCLDLDVSPYIFLEDNVNQFDHMGLTNLNDFLPYNNDEMKTQYKFRERQQMLRVLVEDDSGIVDKTPEGSRQIQQRLHDLVYGWLYQTDAGLYHRTYTEMHALKDGYENWFWPQLKDAEPCGISKISVDNALTRM